MKTWMLSLRLLKEPLRFGGVEKPVSIELCIAPDWTFNEDANVIFLLRGQESRLHQCLLSSSSICVCVLTIVRIRQTTAIGMEGLSSERNFSSIYEMLTMLFVYHLDQVRPRILDKKIRRL